MKSAWVRVEVGRERVRVKEKEREWSTRPRLSVTKDTLTLGWLLLANLFQL